MQIAPRRVRRAARRSTWFLRPLPDVLILGTMKGGSSSAYHYLVQHPEARGAVRKEAHFLDRRYRRGSRWYRGQFPVRMYGQRWLGVDATPFYLSYPLAPERLAVTGIEARFVVLLRDPVERAISHWKYRTRTAREDRPLEAVVRSERFLNDEQLTAIATKSARRYHRLLLVHGHYEEQLSRWYRYFDETSFLILQSESFFLNPQAGMERVFDFLDMKPFTLVDPTPRNVGDGRTASPSVEKMLVEYYWDWNQRLFELLGVEYGWRG